MIFLQAKRCPEPRTIDLRSGRERVLQTRASIPAPPSPPPIKATDDRDDTGSGRFDGSAAVNPAAPLPGSSPPRPGFFIAVLPIPDHARPVAADAFRNLIAVPQIVAAAAHRRRRASPAAGVFVAAGCSRRWRHRPTRRHRDTARPAAAGGPSSRCHQDDEKAEHKSCRDGRPVSTRGSACTRLDHPGRGQAEPPPL